MKFVKEKTLLSQAFLIQKLKVTKENVENNIEFINWCSIPFEYITSEIKEKFGSSVDGLKLRLWFEELFLQMEIKFDFNVYPNHIFFFVNNKWFMYYDFNAHFLGCHDNIWQLLNVEYSMNDAEIQLFLKRITKNYINNILIADHTIDKIFRETLSTYIPTRITNFAEMWFLSVEQYFKNKKQI